MEAAADGETEEPGRLSTETVEERRARLIRPAAAGSRAWRRFNLALLVVLVVVLGVFFGVVPGSSALGRYPVWQLYDLAARIEATPRPKSDCGPGHPADARVDLLTGRVVVDADYLLLSEEDRAMVTFDDEGTWSAPSVDVTRVAVGAPALCVM